MPVAPNVLTTDSAHHAAQVRGFKRQVRIWSDPVKLGDNRNQTASIGLFLGKADGHEVAVRVENYSLACRQLTGKNPFRRKDGGILRDQSGDWIVADAGAIFAPVCSRRQHQMIGTVSQQIFCRGAANAAHDFNVRHT